MTIHAVIITDETYAQYTEFAEDLATTVLEKEIVINNVLLFEGTSTVFASRFWWMSMAQFEKEYDIVSPSNETDFAVVQPK